MLIPGGFAIFRRRALTRYLGARLCSALAVQMIVIAVGWQVYQLTGRVLDLGFVGLSQFLPFLCLSLFAGHAADRHDRRRIILCCQIVYLISAMLLLGFAWRGIASVAPIFAVLALLGIARSFLVPASQSFLPNIVPLAELGNAVAVNSSTTQLANILGPSLGGLIYAAGEVSASSHHGAQWVYGSAAGLLSASISLLLLVRGHRATVAGTVRYSWGHLLEGVRFTWRRKTVLGAISLDLFAVLFGGAAALLPAFTREVLHAGPEVFGYLRAAPAVGAVAMAVWLAFRPIIGRVGVCMFGGVAMFGMATVVFGMARHLWIALASLSLMGAGDMISVYVRGLLVQLATPDAIRGRVSAVSSIAIGASNELGEFESGATAAWLGLVPAIVLGGVVTLTVALLWAKAFFPMLWRLQSFEQLKYSGAADGTPRAS
ncbi:MAG TPA: MFS transporter [Steroidobacteraceae bacterium]|nr:MFS transporter [Steroidobacteraceae bacterium]